jgi:hypothetical protein
MTCAACGHPSTPRVANMTDTSGGAFVELCSSCAGTIHGRADRIGDGCVFCGSTAEPSRSCGLVFDLRDGHVCRAVCDPCRIGVLQPDELPRAPVDRRAQRGLEAGDRVLDRDDDGDNPSHATVLRFHDRADRVTVPVDGEPTVAQVNPEYPPDAEVAEVAFNSELGRACDEWRTAAPSTLADAVGGVRGMSTYSYPEPRLTIVRGRTPWGRAAADREARA